MSADANGIEVDPVSEENKTKAEEAKEAANKLFNGKLICVVTLDMCIFFFTLIGTA